MVVVQCRSRQMFDSHSIQTILKAAGLSVVVKETQRAGHATEIVRSLQLDQCDALITVGGDGTVFEALQVMTSCASVFISNTHVSLANMNFALCMTIPGQHCTVGDSSYTPSKLHAMQEHITCASVCTHLACNALLP